MGPKSSTTEYLVISKSFGISIGGTPPLSGGGGGEGEGEGVEPPTKLSKTEGLTGSQFLEGGC